MAESPLNVFFALFSGLVIVVTLAISPLAFSKASSSSTNWVESRQQYQIALKHLKKGKKKKFESYKTQLEKDLYPLAPYLTYYSYKKNLATVPDEEIITFIDQNWDSPISAQLKQRWLKQLATAKNWDAFIEHFVPEEDAKNDELLCNQANAWLDQKQTEKAFAAAKKLWLVGRSQSKACDKVFKAWKNAGLLTPELVWSRIELAMHKGKVQLARFLAKKLPIELKKDFILWESLFASPHQLPGKLDRFEDIARHRNIILHVLSRWVRSDKAMTLQWLDRADQRFRFSHEELNTHASYIARYISFTFNPKSKYWLMEVDMSNSDKKVQEKRLEIAIRSQDWPAIILWASQPTDSVWEASRLKYWKARAHEALAKIQSQRLMTQRWPSINTENLFYIHRLHKAALSTELGAELFALDANYFPQDAWTFALKSYKELSGLRDYYGFLSSEKLEVDLSLNDRFKPVRQRVFAEVENTPGFRRARELFMMNDKGQAYREWRHTVNRLPLEQKGIAARVAESWGWSYQAIVTASKSDEQNNLELRFPKAYKDSVAYQAHKNDLDTGWVFAVIRQESAFRADARSGVGAMGLMQLMPATAKHVSRGLGLAAPSRRQLLTPEFNIRLGTSYLKELRDEFDNNIVMATAAYNAGPHRVREWRPKEPMPGDIWVETIPFKETREYVKNIMTYQAIYKYRMGLIADLSTDLETIWPKDHSSLHQQTTQLVQNSQ